MYKISKNQSGFTVVEVLLLVIALAIISFGSYYVYRSQVKYNNASNKSSAGSNNLTANNSSTATSAYAGWKSYCDKASKSCFYYPSSWTAQAGLGNQGISITNSPATIEVGEDVSPGASTCTNKNLGMTAQLYVNSINNVTSSAVNLKVIGGYFINNFNGATVYNPYYELVTPALISQYNAAVGSTVTFPDAYSCYTYGFNNMGDAGAQPINNTVNSSAQTALGWLNSSDAKTGLKILQSVYSQ